MDQFCKNNMGVVIAPAGHSFSDGRSHRPLFAMGEARQSQRDDYFYGDCFGAEAPRKDD